MPGAAVARRGWQQRYRCLPRAQPGPERSGGTRPNPPFALSEPSESFRNPHPPRRITPMGSTVSLPLWLLVVLALLAAWAALDRLMVPSVRWLVRQRTN